MNEKKKIEKATAEGFLHEYNSRFGTDFAVYELSEAPDVKCRDSNREKLNLEITLTEDRSLDIKAALGRSNHRNIEVLREQNKRVAEGKERPRFSSLSGNVLEQIVGRINKKLIKNYGSNTALVVRDTSGVDWDWNTVVEDLRNRLNLENNPFDKGIWILNCARTKLYKVV